MRDVAISPPSSSVCSQFRPSPVHDCRPVMAGKQSNGQNATNGSDLKRPADSKRLSFEEELTFSPTLNDRSKKLAQSKIKVERKMRIGSQQRTATLLEEMDRNFTFKPKLSNGSNRIARSLKHDFWARQAIHFNNQKKKLVRDSRNPASNEKLISQEKKENSILLAATSSCPVLRHQRMTDGQLSRRKKRRSDGQIARKEGVFNNKSSIRHSVNVKEDKHSTLLEENVSLTMELHRKKVVLKQAIVAPKAVDINPDRLYQTKQEAEKALKNKKVFICHGPYASLRLCLRQRGWVEKYFNPNAPSAKEHHINSNCNVNDAVHLSRNTVNTTGHDCGRNASFCHPSFDDDDQYGIMSRIARNALPSFIWTCKRDDIDFKFLKKDQLVNHYLQAGSFTTKAGLCVNLRNLPWFEPVASNEFFPRCHRLSSEEEQLEFVDDYRLTAAISILKWTVSTYGEEASAAVDIKKETTTEDVLPIELSNSVVSSRAIDLALKACQSFILKLDHADIDSSSGYDLTDGNWSKLLEYFYQLSHERRRLEGGNIHVKLCKDMLRKIEPHLAQIGLDGVKNIWIIKPGAKSRGRGIVIMCRLDEILGLVSSNVFSKENRLIVQKYVECPLLIYNTKFDIRQWFLVTDWNPLTIWFYKDSYLRFCGQEFTLEDFELQVHLANNSIQKCYKNGTRSSYLPQENMWSSAEFKEYLTSIKRDKIWDESIYPGMKKCILYALESCQDTLEYRKNSFELYGADFLLDVNYKPWLIEINCSPAIGPSTAVTKQLCNKMIDDMLKVVIDRRENRAINTGAFELAFKQPHVSSPSYIGSNLMVEGLQIRKPAPSPTRMPTISPKQSTRTPDSEGSISPTDEERKSRIEKRSSPPSLSSMDKKQGISVASKICPPPTCLTESTDVTAPTKDDKKTRLVLSQHTFVEIPMMNDNGRISICAEKRQERSVSQQSIGFRTKFYRCRQLTTRTSPTSSSQSNSEGLSVDTRGSASVKRI